MDVNQIFKDLAVMIHDQGEMIGESDSPQSTWKHNVQITRLFLILFWTS